MTAVVAIGLQWGDEGKGKIVDVLSASAHAVGRFQGGHNAGHTICIDNETIVLHLIPSGILHPDLKCYIGAGVVLSPENLYQEIEALESRGVQCRKRLFVSPLCPLLLECHRAIDKAREAKAKQDAIGTTIRGIGPAYEDQVARRGIRVGDLRDPQKAREHLMALFEYHNFMLVNYYHAKALDAERIIESMISQSHQLLDLCTDVEVSMSGHLLNRDNVLLEGAQGAMLDNTYGTYPYVTSSHTLAGYAAIGLGVPPRCIDKTIGIIKAYTTRVGNGPFPTELDLGSPVQRHLSDKGDEFGATTGRARRCGWLDLAAIKRMVDLNGVSALCLTKLDVLDGLPDIRYCTHYPGDGEAMNYQAMDGWPGPTQGAQHDGDLPTEAQRYIEMIEEYTQCPIAIISTGAGRKDVIIREDLFAEKCT